MSRLIALSVLCLYRYVTVMPIKNSWSRRSIRSLEQESIHHTRAAEPWMQVNIQEYQNHELGMK